jgi:hypothetical protein
VEILKRYITKHANYTPFILVRPNKKLQNVVVIPAIGEPELIKTVESLWKCKRSNWPVEVVIVINSSENSSSEILDINEKNIQILDNWGKKYNSDDFKVFVINIPNIPISNAGAGYARKSGMDEAIVRFIKADKSNGIITSLDADAFVSENYLIEIEKLFNWDKDCTACSIYFEHPIEGNDFDSKVYHTIIDYELHLRYYKQMLKYVGFPYYHHTVGSSFAVSSKAYCNQGGMNKKQAGEDFYFLHKIMLLGHYYELNSTCVFPSSRPSDRVPFGTGATIRQFAIEDKKNLLTYHFEVFEPLKKLFADKELFFKINQDHIEKQISTYHKILLEFLIVNNFKSAIVEINSNTSNLNSFYKRFFVWFDAFRLIKYLNFAHTEYFKKQSVSIASVQCLNVYFNEYPAEQDSKRLLEIYRQKEKSDLYFL